MHIFSTKKAVKSNERPARIPNKWRRSHIRQSEEQCWNKTDAAFRECAEQRGRTKLGMIIADIPASWRALLGEIFVACLPMCERTS